MRNLVSYWSYLIIGCLLFFIGYQLLNFAVLPKVVTLASTSKEISFERAVPGIKKPNCSTGLSGSLRYVYTFDAKWKKNINVCSGCFNFPQATLRARYGHTPIYIYEPKNDIWVSGQLKSRGSFEPEKTASFIKLLKKDSGLNFIDIGANIGVHTLAIAKMGRKVLAVEALTLNLQHMCASISAGKLEENITLVHNAITDSHTTVSLGVDKNNMGGTYVDVDATHIKELKLGRAKGNYGLVDTVTLDDLVNLPIINQFSKVIIKMDIEGFEHKAIAKLEKFFKRVNVQGFVMEWEFHRKRESGQYILKRMEDLNYFPYRVDNPSVRLNVDQSASWSYDVLWRPHQV